MDEKIRESIERCPQKERFELVTRLGNDILVNGGEIFRANEAMAHAARQFHVEGFDAYVIANGIFSTAVVDGRMFSSRICYVPLAPIMLCRVEALNTLSRQIAAGECGPEEVKKELDRIEEMQSAGNLLKIIAAGFGSASFCYIFKGSWYDSFAAFLAGVMLYTFILYVASKLSGSHIMRNIISSCMVALFVCTIHALGIGNTLDRIMIGAVFPMVPGVPLTNAIRNFLENDYLSGIIRLVDALVTAGSIATGVGAALRIWALVTGGAFL